MTRTNGFWAVGLALTVAAFAASAAVSPLLPETVPTHWNIHGQVDGHGSKNLSLWLLPAFMLGMLGLFRCLPALSPKSFEVDVSRNTYLFITATVIGLFAYLHGVILFATWAQVTGSAKWFDIGRVIFGGIFLYLALLGNVMGKVRRNFYIGIKVPWTLASDRVWNDTHRLAAWTMVGGGLIGFIIVVSGLSLLFAIAALLLSFVIPTVYSFVHYKQLERSGAL